MDLLMGDLLKTTRASQVFAVTGAPDVRLLRLKRKNGNGPAYRVELLGLDVFDPVTMQTDHRKGDDVPAWLARVVYEWITGEGDAATPPVEEFRNRGGTEHAVRVDSKVVEEMSSGIAKSDESRRLRFVLDTIGKTAWPGGKPSDEYLELVEKLNRKAAEEGRPRIDPKPSGYWRKPVRWLTD